MKRTMIEIEYVRKGEFQQFAWIDDMEQGEPYRFDTETSPRRKRVAPHILDATIAFLKHPCWSRVDKEGYPSPTRTFLPPATVLRQRTLTVEFGEWEPRYSAWCGCGDEVILTEPPVDGKAYQCDTCNSVREPR